MNLYLRYFDQETFVSSVEEALDFLRSIPEINLTPEMEADIRDYASRDVFFPKRYKVRPRVYFIVIKTSAATMQDFKEKKALRPNASVAAQEKHELAVSAMNRLNEDHPGWYEGTIDYRDTRFVAQVKAMSGQDCYNRIVEHLRSRVDSRSQFPSAKGKNFRFRYLGMWK